MKTPPVPCYRRQQGFTLLELIVSLSLTAMLLGMLSAGVYSVVNDWQRETSGLDDSLDKALVLLQLERALMSAFPHSYIDQERLSKLVYFEGSEHELRFVSAVSPQRDAGLTAWRLVSSRENGVELMLTPAFTDNPDDRFERLTLQPLLPGYEAEFRYLLQSNAEEKEWLSEWAGDQKQSLPLAVQIVFSPLEANGRDQVLEIMAPVKAWRHEEIDPVTTVF